MSRWTHIRIPVELKERLERMAARELDGYSTGQIRDLPGEFCEHVPLYYVIRRACDELDGKRHRSNRKNRQKGPEAVPAG